MERYSLKPSDITLEKIREGLNLREIDAFSPHAAYSTQAIRRRQDEPQKGGYRQEFSVDVDRILHSLAYTRYIDKTQVFYLVQNDHITHRVLHVQLVSKIARTIGRFLRLNEDLIEAIALAHDIGHTPFGHDGERMLSELCRAHGIGFFHHNLQSVQFLDKVERKGKGWNLCLQTLDGIVSHDGEIHDPKLEPVKDKTFESLEKFIVIKKENPDTNIAPMTLEGCVVRMADTISYIGRDLEDAIRLNMIQRDDIPKECVERLGNTNGTIVYNLVTDVIENSYQKGYTAFSPDVSAALERLKNFNLEHIYTNPAIKKHLKTIEELFKILFDRYIRDLADNNCSSAIFSQFLENMSTRYSENHNHAEIVRDFISGMTDQYFLRQCPDKMRPKPLPL